MTEQTDSVAASENAQMNCLRRILTSTRGLLDQIEENAADLVADDWEPTPAFPQMRSLKVFLAGALLGAGSVFGIMKYAAMHESADEMATALIRERAAETQTLTPTAEINLPLTDDLAERNVAESNVVAPQVPDSVETFTVEPQQSLSTLLRRGGLSGHESRLVTEALSEILDVKKIQVGDKVEIGKMNTDTDAKTLLSVTIEDRRGNRFTAARVDADLFEASLIEPEVDLKTEYADGTIDGAFITNAQNAGIPTNVIQQIIWAFDGPVDFSRDLRKGDSFTAVFQKEYNKDGQPTGNGSLLYAALNLRSQTHERYMYKDSNDQEDYYDEKGRIARKLFTMHPLKNPRQTSKFGQRKHPILGYTLMHWGADFGAPIGTPIRAPGEGTITQMQKRGSYGLYVKIKHNSEYSTAYAHMGQFNDSLKVGQRVKPGHIIGYVGNTGRSTGPHLHWELIRNGKKINPTTQRITAQRKLTGEELGRFMAERDRMRSNIDGETAYARAQALPESRKLAYQGPQKEKKAAKNKRKGKTQKTALRKTSNPNG